MVTISTPITKADIAFLRMILSQNEEVVMMEDKNISVNINSRKGMKWTDQEDDILLKGFDAGKKPAEIYLSIPGRDAKSCANRLYSLGARYR